MKSYSMYFLYLCTSSQNSVVGIILVLLFVDMYSIALCGCMTIYSSIVSRCFSRFSFPERVRPAGQEMTAMAEVIIYSTHRSREKGSLTNGVRSQRINSPHCQVTGGPFTFHSFSEGVLQD